MYRFCVDFRYIIPNVDELTEAFTQHIPNFISSIDLSSDFFQLLISLESTKYAAFNTCFGTYRIHVFVMYIELFFFIKFWCRFFVWMWLCWEILVLCWRISSISYDICDKVSQKRQQVSDCKNFNFYIFHLILMQFFFVGQMIIFTGYWWTIKYLLMLCMYYWKRDLKGP